MSEPTNEELLIVVMESIGCTDPSRDYDAAYGAAMELRDRLEAAEARAVAAEGREFLLAIKAYIEQTEEATDGEWGSCRSLDKLIAAGEMPDLYAETLRRLDALAEPTPGERGEG